MKIVLFEPQIPQNTGNIVRTCSVTGQDLVLIKPFGFKMSDRLLKRAGLDYWKSVSISQIDDLLSFLENLDNNFYIFTTKTDKKYVDVSYNMDDVFVFGSETKGLPEYVFKKWPSNLVTIPMKNKSRCLNLSNSVSIAIYEALRQNNFKDFSRGF